jgi:trigger factor
LKTKIKENLKLEKEQKAKDKRRGEIIEVLLKKMSVEVPAIFVESELEKIMGQLKDDVVRFGLTFEKYLKQVNKTEAQLRNEFRDQAHKRATLQLVLNKIAEEAKIEPDPEAVKTEMGHALKHFPDARPDLLKVHIETILRNEKTLQLLEGSEEKA